MRIVLLTRGYGGLNVFNIYVDNDNLQKNYSDKQVASVLESIKKELNCLV